MDRREMAYRLGKRAISQFIRSDCQRRLRLDLFATARDRAAASAPDKDNRRPGLALLTQAGRSHERRKFAELIEVLPGLVTHGLPAPFREGEEQAYGTPLGMISEGPDSYIEHSSGVVRITGTAMLIAAHAASLRVLERACW
jgi:hypothetical protein